MTSSRSGVRRGLCIVLSLMLAMSPGFAQQAAPKALNIVIVEGEGAINNIRQRVAREPIVQVEDENHKPVAGALVTFLLPSNGPGATFADGSNTLTVQTDASGRATARGLRANRVDGQYQVRVTVSYQGLTASASFGMVNAVAAAAAAGGVLASAKFWILMAVVGGAVAGGTYATVKSQSNPTQAPVIRPPTTITPGTPVVNPPR